MILNSIMDSLADILKPCSALFTQNMTISHLQQSRPHNNYVLNSINDNDVRNAIQFLKPNHTTGPNKILQYIINSCTDVLVPK